MPRLFAAFVPFFLLIPTATAQRKLDPGHNYERVLAVVPMTGAGTAADPRRPPHAPAKADANGIVSFSYQVSDDGRFAIVELVARSRAALAPILAGSQPVDRRGDAQERVRVGSAGGSDKGFGEGKHDWGGRNDAGSQCGHAQYCEAREWGDLRRVSEETGQGSRDREADPRTAKMDRKRKKKMSNEAWTNRNDPMPRSRR